MLGPTEAQQEIRQIVRHLSETEGLCDSPPDPSIVDRVMQLQQSHPPILVGAGDLIQLPARPDSQCADRTGKSLATGSVGPRGIRQTGDVPGLSCWLGWSPPPESNRRPHPYHGTTRNRSADRRSPRSRPTVGVEVIGSLPGKLCALSFSLVLIVARASHHPAQRSRAQSTFLQLIVARSLLGRGVGGPYCRRPR